MHIPFLDSLASGPLGLQDFAVSFDLDSGSGVLDEIVQDFASGEGFEVGDSFDFVE